MRAERVGQLLADADDDIGVGVARRARRARTVSWPGDFDRVLEQLDGEPVGERAGRGVVVVPDGMRGNEAFRKADDARAVGGRPRGSARQALAVEPSRSRNTEAACTAATFTVPGSVSPITVRPGNSAYSAASVCDLVARFAQ